MRIINNGAICAVQAREMRRAEKWRQHMEKKEHSRKAARDDGQRNDRKNNHGR